MIDHLAASGNPPVEEVTDREPVLDEWYTEEEYFHSTPHIAIGREARWHRKGTGKQLVKEYRAFAEIGMPEYPANERRYSKSFEAHDAMDVVRVTGYSANPQGLQHEADIAAAVARSHRQHHEAAPSDMRKLAQDMASDLLLEYHPWRVKFDRHAARLLATESLRAQVAAMVEDIAEFGTCSEYQAFIHNVSTLLGKKDS